MFRPFCQHGVCYSKRGFVYYHFCSVHCHFFCSPCKQTLQCSRRKVVAQRHSWLWCVWYGPRYWKRWRVFWFIGHYSTLQPSTHKLASPQPKSLPFAYGFTYEAGMTRGLLVSMSASDAMPSCRIHTQISTKKTITHSQKPTLSPCCSWRSCLSVIRMLRIVVYLSFVVKFIV